MGETLVDDYRLLMCGCDFSTPNPYLPKMIADSNEAIDDIEFKMGSLQEYFTELGKRIDRSQVPVSRRRTPRWRTMRRLSQCTRDPHPHQTTQQACGKRHDPSHRASRPPPSPLSVAVSLKAFLSEAGNTC